LWTRSPNYPKQLHGSHKLDAGLMLTPLYELHDEPAKAQLMLTPVSELPGDLVEQELAGIDARNRLSGGERDLP